MTQDFWVEVVNIACYLVNRSLTLNLVDKTPYEAWTSRKPYLAHLKVFGCDAFVHIPKVKRRKLDSKLKKCVFIKYKDRVKGYELWNLVTRTVVYNRDVIFKEFRCTYKNEEVKKGKELEKLEFNLSNESQ